MLQMKEIMTPMKECIEMQENKWMAEKLDNIENCFRHNSLCLVGLSVIIQGDLQKLCETVLPKNLGLPHC